MKMEIKQTLNNKKGSSLAFVLIIGVIIMIMVVSLLTVANSDFTFTQETVESRQSYIDAKSVIEFGKVEINKRMSALKKIDKDIQDAQTNPNTSDAVLTDLKNQRTTLMEKLDDPFTVYGALDSVTENLIMESLSFSNEAYNGLIKKELGLCTVMPTTVETTTEYLFDIKTQNLRRKLDYQVEFNYNVSTASIWTPSTFVPKSKPTEAEISAWIKTNIYTNNNNKVYMDITGSPPIRSLSGNTLYVNEQSLSLNIGKDDADFQWIKNKTLDLTANNIYVTDPLPIKETGGQIFQTNTVFEMTATDILFKDNLDIGENVTVELTCENLWVGGNIILSENSTLIVNGKNTTSDVNQMIVEGKIIKTAGDSNGNSDKTEIDISNLAYFQCAGLDINNCDLFNLDAKTILIRGNILLEDLQKTDNSNQSPMNYEITTQYFDCSGTTSIFNSGVSSEPIVFSPDGNVLNIRFGGGYDQQRSHVDINGADKVVFGKSFNLKSQNPDGTWYWLDQWPWQSGWELFYWEHLYIKGDNIYLEGNEINMTWSAFIYDYNKSNNINVYIQSKINYLDNTEVVGPGSYTGQRLLWWLPQHKEQWRHNWQNWVYFGRIVKNDLIETGDYPSGSSGGGVITGGTEKYY